MAIGSSDATAVCRLGVSTIGLAVILAGLSVPLRSSCSLLAIYSSDAIVVSRSWRTDGEDSEAGRFCMFGLDGQAGRLFHGLDGQGNRSLVLDRPVRDLVF